MGIARALSGGMHKHTYRTMVIAGATRLTRPSTTVTPLPEVRCARTPVNRYARVAAIPEKTRVMTFSHSAITIPVRALRDRFL